VAAPSTSLRLAVSALAVAVLVLALGAEPERARDDGAYSGPARPPLPDAVALTEDAMRLYAAGQFARACERFEPAQVSASCFQVWGWRTLREGHPEDAMQLFRQGLGATPDAPALLRGLGVAAIHAGRADEAVGPLETAERLDFDPQVSLLLARLYDSRDQAERAVAHVRTVLAREPAHDGARRLLDKLERETRAEAGFQSEANAHFVVKSRAAVEADRRVVLHTLEAARERVGRELGVVPPERVVVVLYDRQQFGSVTRVHGWVTGLFDGKIRLPVAPLPPRRELERLVIHEYAHAAIHYASRGQAPRWLHEGLAQSLEGVARDPMLTVPGHLTLSGVEALVTDPDPVRARAGYDVALWLVQDLLERGGMDAMRELLLRLGRGEPLAAAVGRAYGQPQADLESRWRRVLGG